MSLFDRVLREQDQPTADPAAQATMQSTAMPSQVVTRAKNNLTFVSPPPKKKFGESLYERVIGPVESSLFDRVLAKQE